MHIDELPFKKFVYIAQKIFSLWKNFVQIDEKSVCAYCTKFWDFMENFCIFCSRKNTLQCIVLCHERVAPVGRNPPIIPHPPSFVNRQNAQTLNFIFVYFYNKKVFDVVK